jgi:hypothetical protein
MADDITLQLTIGESTITTTAQLTGSDTSPFTGRTLRLAESVITIPADAADAFSTALDQPVADQDCNQWHGTVRTTSYTSDGLQQHEVEWGEVEALHADHVEFQGLSLQPVRYHEEFDDDVVAITLQALLSAEDAQRLRQLEAQRRLGENTYWPVIRRGVSDEPRTMRLGQLLWERRDDDQLLYQLTLVDAAYDDAADGHHGLADISEPHLSHTMDHALHSDGRIDALLNVLQDAGVIDAETRAVISEGGRRAVSERRHELFEVSDVESHWLHEF